MNTEEIEKEFGELIDELDRTEWIDWCMSWCEPDIFTDIYNNWDTETKKDVIDDLKKIIAERQTK